MRDTPDKIVLIASAVSAVLLYFVLALDECHDRGGTAACNIICVEDSNENRKD